MAEPILARLHAHARHKRAAIGCRCACCHDAVFAGPRGCRWIGNRVAADIPAREDVLLALVDSGTDEDNWDHEQPDGEGYHSQVTQQKVFHMCWSLSDGSSKFIAIDKEANHQIVHAFRLGKHSVRRTNRLIRVRRLMCLLSIFCVFSLPT